MDVPRKAEDLVEAYRLLDPDRPLEAEWLQAFYAERPEESSINFLMKELLADASTNDKTIFTGHRGSGKTTELARLEETLQPTHTVVRFNADSMLNLGDVDYADVLVVLGLQVFRAARRSGLELDRQKADALIFWYETHVLEEDEKRRLRSEVGGEINAAVAKFSVKMATDAPRRKTIRSQAQANLGDLLERLNLLLVDLAKKSGRRTMVIVDGLDKVYDLKQVRGLFYEGANALLEPRCRALYTVPLALYHTNEFQQVRMSFPRHFLLSNVKVAERDGAPCPEGRDALSHVLDCRVNRGLFSSEATERLVDLCGGVLRELVSLARAAVNRGRRVHGEGGPVTADDVEYAARRVRNTYRGVLEADQYRELWRIYRGEPFTNSPVARELLHNLSLLQYDGGDAWWGINPIVRPLLEERAGELGAQG